MRKKAGRVAVVVAVAVFFAAVAVGIAYLLKVGGRYPAGTDTMCHVYKGNVLYQSIKGGSWYPLYDRFWYNGVQMMRYWAPLPVYFLAFCQMLAGGSEITGYLVFVGMVFFLGAVVWLYIGYKKERRFLGAFLGVLWFFMPNNLFALFVEGNLPRSLSMVLLPLLFYLIYEYMFENQWNALWKIIPVFMGIVLCHTGYAGMVLLAMLVFLLVYRLVYKKKGRCLPVLISMLLPFALSGIWLYASLKGGITSTDSSQVMKEFFQDAWISLNPLRRLTNGNVDFYFGFAAFVVAVFGAFCSRRKEMAGFFTALIIFICTTGAMYPVLEKLPGSQHLWMLRFISIALCMILYSFFCWTSLRKWMAVLCCILLVLDVVPSLTLIYSGKGAVTAESWMKLTAENDLIDTVWDVTKQRAAMIDESSLGAMAQYLLTDYNDKQIPNTFGAGWQSAATAHNITQLNEAASKGYYTYLFDRAMELGDDTVLIQISQLKNQEEDIDKVTNAAEKLGYCLVDTNTGYLVYHLDTYDTFGTVCKYNGIGIGTSSPLLSLCYPDIEEGASGNLNDYTFEELSEYKLVYLAGFTYKDKKEAENLVVRLGEAGVTVLIDGNGIPVDERKKTQEFLGVQCHSILFENGYPILYKNQTEYDCNLFERDYADWQTVYLNGLDEADGYLYDSGRRLDFMGTVKNENIHVIGLNLPYHYMLTQDKQAGELLDGVLKGCLNEIPARETVPLEIEYGADELVIYSEKENVNTTLAYHDIFVCSKEVEVKQNLLQVQKGTTRITMQYPYLAEGLLLSGLGLLLTGVFVIWLKRRAGECYEYEQKKAD